MARVIRMPVGLVPNEVVFTLDRNVAEFRSPIGGTVQRDERPGEQWVATVNLPPLNDEKGALIEAFFAQFSRGDTHVIFPVQHRPFRGNLDVTEKLLNPTFKQGVAGWDTGAGTLSMLGQRLKVLSPSALEGAYATQDIAGASLTESYVLIGDFHRQVNADPYIWVQESDGTPIDETATSSNEASRLVLGFSPTATALKVGLQNTAGTTSSYSIWQSVSLRKAPRVNGASQEGSILEVTGMQANVTGAAKVGDYFTLDGFLYCLLEDMDTDANGDGTLIFEPNLRTVPANDVPVIFGAPYMKCTLEAGSRPNYSRGLRFSEGVTFDLREDLTR